MTIETDINEISLYWNRDEMAKVTFSFSTIVSFHISFKHKPEILKVDDIYPHFHRYIQHDKVTMLSHFGNEKAIEYATSHYRESDGTYKCVPLQECIDQLIRLSDPNNYSEIECYPGKLELTRGDKHLSAEFFELRAADIGFEYKVIIEVIPWTDYVRALEMTGAAHRDEGC